jgi:carbonic anhydrase/acetyltransferase-like protein (isoleucine patch superfamily)
MVAPVVIEEDVVIGAGAVITRGKRIKSGDTVVGVPARSLSSRNNDR